MWDFQKFPPKTGNHHSEYAQGSDYIIRSMSFNWEYVFTQGWPAITQPDNRRKKSCISFHVHQTKATRIIRDAVDMSALVFSLWTTAAAVRAVGTLQTFYMLLLHACRIKNYWICGYFPLVHLILPWIPFFNQESHHVGCDEESAPFVSGRVWSLVSVYLSARSTCLLVATCSQKTGNENENSLLISLLDFPIFPYFPRLHAVSIFLLLLMHASLPSLSSCPLTHILLWLSQTDLLWCMRGCCFSEY